MVRKAVDEAWLRRLECGITACAESTRHHGGDIYGIRNILSQPAIRAFAGSDVAAQCVVPVLGEHAGAVRGIFFDKTARANWPLRWHRDWAIAVNRRVDADGYGPWSVKAGVPHVYPPAAVLENMVTLRVHLDACDELNGALKVIPGSHRRLDVDEASLSEHARREGVVVCVVERGDAVLMRPLIAHSSDKCETPAHRRVIHIEYAAAPLPPPLNWNAYVPICGRIAD